MLTPDASVVELFLELAAVPSPSGRERALADQIRTWLAAHGIIAEFDGTGELNGSDAGNLIATVPGAAGAPGHLFVAHIDTVESGTLAVSPQLGADGVIRSGGDTILGADNKSAVAAVMCLCRAARRMPGDGRPTVVAAFTCREESGRMGASLLDLSPWPIQCAFSVDGSRPIGTVITRALGQTTFIGSVHGRAAHAAADPDAGVNAIAVAAEIIAALPIGRRPDGGSLNIASIVGGTVIDRLSPEALGRLGVAGDADGPTAIWQALETSPTNLVPDLAMLRGEVRGYSLDAIERDVKGIADVVADVCQAHGARNEWVRDVARMVPPMPGAAASRALALARAAAEAVPGVRFVAEEAQATLEANYLVAQTDVVALASGGRDPHQLTESISVTELQQLEAFLVAILEASST